MQGLQQEQIKVCIAARTNKSLHCFCNSQVTILRKIRGNSQKSFLGIRENSQESFTGKSGENVDRISD